MDAIVRANQVEVLPLRQVEDELREIVKDTYGDDYDAAVANTCEPALRIACEVLFARSAGEGTRYPQSRGPRPRERPT